MIWTFSSNHMHSGKTVVDITTYLAVCIFNGGFSNILKIIETIGIEIGLITQNFVALRNENRITRSELWILAMTKEARTAIREKRAAREAMFEAEKGPLYGLGIDDYCKL